ncbi:unnamed protein product [Symbiodinium sp. CCMP2592]|nr:unnamed protein product [Symbiodinium sp. CCMP2592]
MAMSEPNPMLAFSEAANEQVRPMRALLEGSGIPEPIWKDLSVFAPDEFGSLSEAEIQEFLDGITYPAEPSDLLVKARIRLLWRRCLKWGATLQPDPPQTTPMGGTGAIAEQASWSEAFPRRLSGDTVRQMVKSFSEKYPSEPLSPDIMPSPRLLSLVHQQLQDKRWRWIPWKLRLSEEQYDSKSLKRSLKAPRLENLLWEEIPSRELPTQGMAKSVMAELVHLQAVAIALADGAHLYTLREMNRKFLAKCFDHLPRDAGLRVPNRLEAETAEKQLWQQISVLFNEENWTMDQAIREVVVARNELHVLLMPRAVAPKIPWLPWQPRRIKGDGKQGSHGKGGKGDKGSKGGTKDGKGSQRHTLMVHGLRAFLLEIAADVIQVAACSYGSSYAKHWAFATSWRPLQQLQSTCRHTAGHHDVFHGKRDATGQFVSRHTAVFPPMLCNAFMEAISPLFPENTQVTGFTSLHQALSALPVRPLNDFPTGQQDGGGIYSQPDWTSPPAGQKDTFRQLRQDLWGFFKQHKLFDRLRKHVSESSQKPLIQQHELPALRAIWEDWFRAQGFADSVSWEIAPDQPYCLQALELLSKALDDRDVELWKDLQVAKLLQSLMQVLRSDPCTKRDLQALIGLLHWVLQMSPELLPWLCCLYHDMSRPLGTNFSLHAGAWQQLADTLTDDLHFRKSPPGSTIPPGSKLLSARHVEIKCKADLRLVRATGKRIWIRVADASSSKRRISTVSRQFIMFWVHFCMRPQMPSCLSLPPLDFQYSLAADACAKGNDIGIGGWVELPNQPIVWFSEWFTVQDFRSLGLPMQDDANLDITAYETLAQLALLIAFISITPTGRLRVCIPSWSDNSGTESLTNKLFTVHTPLCFFAQKLATRSWQSGISLDCTHIAGCHNDSADFLSKMERRLAGTSFPVPLGSSGSMPTHSLVGGRARCSGFPARC